MPARRPAPQQGTLFDLGPARPPASVAPTRPLPQPTWDALADRVAAALPALRLGTSSWTFPGWAGLVYAPGPDGTVRERDLVRDGLRAYASQRIFGAVGIDRSYYAPLSAADVALWLADLEAASPLRGGRPFRPIAKVWSPLVTAGRGATPFLDPGLFLENVVAPWREAAGGRSPYEPIFVLEFPPMPAGTMAAGPFASALDRFFGALPGPDALTLAVELRNAHLFSPRYQEVLTARRVAHVYNHWTAMPTLDEQRRRFPPRGDVPTVLRLLLPPGSRYEAQKAAFAPFHRIVAVDEAMRAGAVALIAAAAAAGAPEIVVSVNNKAEGCSPETVIALAERALAGR